MRLTIGAGLVWLAAPAIAGEARPILTCFGVEPFWRLEIGEEDATLGAMIAGAPPETAYAIRDERRATGRLWPRVLTLEEPEDAAFALVRPTPCADGMSDDSHAWTVDLLAGIGGEPALLSGCCAEATG